MTLDEAMDFSSAEVFSEPFRYFVSPSGFSDRVGLGVLSWLETGAPWKLIETDFYEQFEFSLLDAETPASLAFLREETFLGNLRRKMEELFRARLGGRVDVTAHKLVPGQRIRVHNDYIAGGETHRLLVQLNRGWKDADGGFLLLFNSPDPAHVHRVLRPLNNTVVGFAISPESNHAVSTVHGGERFTLVYSFYDRLGDS